MLTINLYLNDNLQRFYLAMEPFSCETRKGHGRALLRHQRPALALIAVRQQHDVPEFAGTVQSRPHDPQPCRRRRRRGPHLLRLHHRRDWGFLDSWERFLDLNRKSPKVVRSEPPYKLR